MSNEPGDQCMIGVELDLRHVLEEQNPGPQQVLDLLVHVLDGAHRLGRVAGLHLQNGRLSSLELYRFSQGFDSGLAVDPQHDGLPPPVPQVLDDALDRVLDGALLVHHQRKHHAELLVVDVEEGQRVERGVGHERVVHHDDRLEGQHDDALPMVRVVWCRSPGAVAAPCPEKDVSQVVLLLLLVRGADRNLHSSWRFPFSRDLQGSGTLPRRFPLRRTADSLWGRCWLRRAGRSRGATRRRVRPIVHVDDHRASSSAHSSGSPSKSKPWHVGLRDEVHTAAAGRVQHLALGAADDRSALTAK